MLDTAGHIAPCRDLPPKGRCPIKRITISIDDDLLAFVDARCAEHGYASRSEAFRDMIRKQAGEKDALVPDSEGAVCYAALSYVYDHHTRELSRRLTDAQHAAHHLSVATTHVHISPENCLEIAILRGTVPELRRFGDSIISQRGVRHGVLSIIPTGGPLSPDHGHDHAGDQAGKAGRIAR